MTPLLDRCHLQVCGLANRRLEKSPGLLAESIPTIGADLTGESQERPGTPVQMQPAQLCAAPQRQWARGIQPMPGLWCCVTLSKSPDLPELIFNMCRMETIICSYFDCCDYQQSNKIMYVEVFLALEGSTQMLNIITQQRFVYWLIDERYL